MSDIPTVPDSDRISTASLSASVGPVTVGFAVFGGAADLSVLVDGELIDPADWTLTSNSGLNVTTDVLPANDGRVTFDNPQTGDVEIIGEINPKRISQFTSGVGIPAESFNLVFSTIAATLRELYSWGKAALKLAPGERAVALPAAADRAGKVLSFSDPGGDPETVITAGDISSAGASAAAAAASASAAQTSENNVIALLNAADFTFYGSGVPSDAFGSDGDVYVNTAHARWSVYGPKTAGAWGSIVGYMFGLNGSGDLSSSANLSDLASPKTGYDNLSVHGSDVASASTIDLDAATGVLVDVTGTTTITAITLSNGRERVVRFTGILTLTNGASLVLPGGANITTAAGDFAIFRGYASSVVRCVGYFPASGYRADLIVGLSGTQTISGNKTYTGLNTIQAMKEKVTITAGAPASTQNFDVLTQAVQYFTSANANNWTLNVRGDGSNSLDSIMSTGQSITIEVIVTNTGTAYRHTAMTIDGNAVTPQWLGAAAPGAGTINKRDTYTFQIIKTASATFIVQATFAAGN